MCTLFINGQTKIVAWTASNQEEPGFPQKMIQGEKRVMLKKETFNASSVEDYCLSPQSGRSGIGRSCFTKKICESRLINGLTHRSGQDDHHKYRRSRSSGSAKALASAAVW